MSETSVYQALRGHLATLRLASAAEALPGVLERAAWEGFLFRGSGSIAAHEVFADAYVGYAEQLAARDAKPETSGRAGDPVQFFIDHLVKPWLWRPEMREALPLRTLLASGKAWLAAEMVEEAGRLIGRTEAKDVAPELAAAYRDLWTFVLDATGNLEGDDLKKALARASRSCRGAVGCLHPRGSGGTRLGLALAHP
jgi:hypothetical protein